MYDCLLQWNGSFSLVRLYTMKKAFTYSRCDRNAFLLTNKQAEKARVPDFMYTAQSATWTVFAGWWYKNKLQLGQVLTRNPWTWRTHSYSCIWWTAAKSLIISYLSTFAFSPLPFYRMPFDHLYLYRVVHVHGFPLLFDLSNMNVLRAFSSSSQVAFTIKPIKK